MEMCQQIKSIYRRIRNHSKIENSKRLSRTNIAYVSIVKSVWWTVNLKLSKERGRFVMWWYLQPVQDLAQQQQQRQTAFPRYAIHLFDILGGVVVSRGHLLPLPAIPSPEAEAKMPAAVKSNVQEKKPALPRNIRLFQNFLDFFAGKGAVLKLSKRTIKNKLK